MISPIRLLGSMFASFECCRITVRAVADKWKAFAQSVSSAADELMKPPFIEGQEGDFAHSVVGFHVRLL